MSRSILLPERTVDKIRLGNKTQMRKVGVRPGLKVGETYCFSSDRLLLDTFGVNVKILATWQERLGKISGKDIKAEGCGSLAEFISEWKKENGSYDANSTVWVIEFNPVCIVGRCK